MSDIESNSNIPQCMLKTLIHNAGVNNKEEVISYIQDGVVSDIRALLKHAATQQLGSTE